MDEIQISYYLRINNLLVQIMEQLKQYVDDGQLEIAKLDNNNKAHKVEYSQLEGQVSRQQKNAKLYKSLEDLTWDEKFEWVTLKRLKGKEIFKEGDYNTAIEIYTEALIGIDLNDKTQSRLSQMKNQLQYPITLNIATCLYMKKQYKRALEICDKVLKQNGNYLPAIYKKVYLLMTCGEHVQAKQLLNYGIKIARQTHQQKQLKEFIQLNGDLMKSAKQNKKFYAKMFNKESDSQDETVDSESSRLISKQQEVEEEEEVLYYEDGFNICGKLSRFGKKLLYFVVPSMNPKNKNKKHINHSKSF